MQLSESLQRFKLAKIGEASLDTIRWYEQRIGTLVSFLDDMPIKDVTIHDLRRWRAWLWEKDSRWADHPGRPEEEGGLSNWTRHGYIRAVRSFFNFLVKEGYLKHSPAQRLKLPPRPNEPPKHVKPEDVLAMLKAAKDNPRDYAIVLFLADSACRVGGLLSLNLEDLDLDGRITEDGEIIYSVDVREKGYCGQPRVRTVYLSKMTVEAMRAYLEVRPRNKGGRLFVGQRGPLSHAGVYLILKRLAQRAGVDGRWHPHAFRHGWARGALINGADLGTVCEVLGHSDIKVTHEFYARWADLELAERHSRFSWINSVDDDAQEDDSIEDGETPAE
jgi:integrase